MRIGLSVRIDVKKIEKSRLYQGEKGTYMDLTTFIDTDEKDQYGNNGFISQQTSKEEREQGVKTPILGNVRVFHVDQSSSPTPSTNHAQPAGNPAGPDYGGGTDDYDDSDIPF